ncbi:hypothetical protein [Microviridae sp.]|nr:hypothetical protein [Microviridae sp.]
MSKKKAKSKAKTGAASSSDVGLAEAQRKPSSVRAHALGHSDPEPCDDTPIALPVGAGTPTPLHILIANMVRQAVADEENLEPETFEESEDFEPENEDESLLDFSKYEITDLQEQEPVESGSPEIPEPPQQAEPAEGPSNPPDQPSGESGEDGQP